MVVDAWMGPSGFGPRYSLPLDDKLKALGRMGVHAWRLSINRRWTVGQALR